MKKYVISLIASIICTVIVGFFTLSAFEKRTAFESKTYRGDFSIIDKCIDGINKLMYNAIIMLFCFPTLFAGIAAVISAVIGILLYNKNHMETKGSRVSVITSFCILLSIIYYYVTIFGGLISILI